jgi:hypothetical protein
MTTFLAYFDVLGFKEIVLNNSLEELNQIFSHLLRDTQTAVSGENYIQPQPGIMVADLTQQKVHCLHISDSVLFWTNGDSEGDFIELARVCYTFYWRSLQLFVPLRGCLVHGEIEFRPFQIKNESGATFHNSSLYGKGLVDAYIKAESVDYAGCYIDQTALSKVEENVINNLIYDQMLCYYKVPFKGNKYSYEHVFRPIKGNHNEVSFRNSAKHIKSLFSYHSKMKEFPESVQVKLNNTLDFIEHFRETDSDLKRPE